MPRIIENNRKDQRKIAFEAIVLTVLLHALLYFLFIYTPSTRFYDTVKSAGVTFMNLNSQSPEQKQQFMNWLEYHDPSLISAPNTKYGYGKLNAPVNFRAARPDTNRQVDFPQSPQRIPEKFQDLTSLIPSRNSRAGNFILQPLGTYVETAPETTAAKPIPPKPQFPLIKCSGQVLKLSLPTAMVKQAETLKAASMDINLSWHAKQILPRTEVVRSSGNRDFDMAVVGELLLQAENIPHSGRNSEITIQWRKEAAK